MARASAELPAESSLSARSNASATEGQIPGMLLVSSAKVGQELVDADSLGLFVGQQSGECGQRLLGAGHVAVVVLMAGERNSRSTSVRGKRRQDAALAARVFGLLDIPRASADHSVGDDE